MFTRTVYRAYFDPLSAYAGPKLWAVSDLPRTFHMLKGDIPYKYAELHETYGPAVRVGPRFLSYNTPEAWNDIYAKVRPEMSRDPKSCPPPPNGVYGLAINPSDTNHSRIR
jgi:aspirochlorine biosynthesis cytochrome P450 monooxygenase